MAKQDYKAIIEDIRKGHFSPVYFLAGEEEFFGKKIEEALLEHVVPEHARGFDLNIIYARDMPLQDVLTRAKQFPMFGGKQLLVVRGAENYFKKDAELKAVKSFMENPPEQTVLSFRYAGKPGAKIKKAFSSPKTVWYEAPRIYENQMPALLQDLLAYYGFKADMKALLMLTEHVGTDLVRMEKEMEKLAIVLEPGETVTADKVEQYTGVSKEFNIFEFKNAVVTGDFPRAYKIAHYFSQNPKEYNLNAIIALLYGFFTQLYRFWILPDKNNRSAVASALKINPYFVSEYQTAARKYPMKKISSVIHTLKEIDLKTKGMNAGQAGYRDLINELLYKIMLQ